MWSLSLCLKGRFYAIFAFVYLMGNNLQQTSGVKPNAIIYKHLYFRGRLYTKYYLVSYIIVPIDLVSMATINES